jgi:hypothetical protein
MVRNGVVGLLVVALAGAGGAGCGAPSQHAHGGKLVTEYPARRKPQFGWTRVPAVYVLYSQKDPPPGHPEARKVRRVGWEMTAIRLERRSPLGFKVVNGSLVAVAGDDQIPLPPGQYCWHTRPYSEPIDWGATVLCGALIAGAAVGIAGLAWVAAWDGISFGPGRS